jgi:hypothetical protein
LSISVGISLIVYESSKSIELILTLTKPIF